ncbi:molybdenum cofactor guanylyltransferase MobA [Sodalis sp.]|uniref:molybdenum cofactor guanylyltransferase MobA n=1 Tax=Sodalis sp. (in: enterobacteria) TaxID=1898979 RepID=UPI0038737974
MATNGITGVILAGGLSTRMGGEDKGLLQINHKPLYRYVADRLAPQVAVLIINSNRNEDAYQHGGFQVVADTFPGFVGPLAGMLTGLRLANSEWVAFVPCDVPVFPHDLVARLWENRQQASAAFASDDKGHDHPTFTLLHRALAPALEAFLRRGGRRVRLFLSTLPAQRVVFNASRYDFMNLNTPQDLDLWSHGQLP